MKTLYTAKATAVGGRHGRATSDDGKLDVALARPVEMGGKGDGTNPEQLFACGYAACFASTVEHLARQRRIELGDVEVRASIGLLKYEQEGFGLEASLEVNLPSLDRETAEAIVEHAKRNCPYSNATRGNVKTSVTVVAAE